MDKLKAEKKITRPLSKYISLIIGYREWGPADMEDALLISEIDKDEQYCHVQFTSLDDDTPFDNPHVWHIKAWKTYHLKVQLDKAKQMQIRKELNLVTENTSLVMRSLAKKYGIEDVEILRGLAYKIAKNKKQEALELLEVTTKLDLGD